MSLAEERAEIDRLITAHWDMDVEQEFMPLLESALGHASHLEMIYSRRKRLAKKLGLVRRAHEKGRVRRPRSTDELTDLERARRRKLEAEDQSRLLTQEAANRADLLGQFTDALAQYPRLVLAPAHPDTRSGQERDLLLLVTDVHTGQLFERVRGGGFGAYNMEVFVERVRRLAAEVIAAVRDFRSRGPVRKIVVWFGGDLLDGRTIYKSHPSESVPLGDQLRIGPEVFARELLGPLAHEIESVVVLGVPGNHGRFGSKGELDYVEDSLDMVYMHIMELHCHGLANVTFAPRLTWFSHFTMREGKWSYFGSHGDTFKSWAGIPFYGAQRHMHRITALTHRPIDVMMTGHHHAQAAFPVGFSKILMNGSFVGSSSFGTHQLGQGGLPMQTLVVVSDDCPALPINLYLASREECLTLESLDL